MARKENRSLKLTGAILLIVGVAMLLAGGGSRVESTLAGIGTVLGIVLLWIGSGAQSIFTMVENANKEASQNFTRLAKKNLGSVDTFKTSSGPITVSWILDDGDLNDLLLGGSQDIEDAKAAKRRKLQELLAADPNIDLQEHAEYLGITIDKVSRSRGNMAWLENALSKATTSIEADRVRRKFLADNNIEEGSEQADRVNTIFTAYESRLLDPDSE